MHEAPRPSPERPPSFEQGQTFGPCPATSSMNHIAERSLMRPNNLER
jgi:hypothetical protein